MRRYRRSGPAYWFWGLLAFRYTGTLMVMFWVLWIAAKCAGY